MTKSFLGCGWKFPVRIDSTTGRIAMSEMEQDIRESINIILGTAPLERLMRPEFGCGIHDLVFSSISTVTIGLFESSVREALTRWEARVELSKLEISTKEADKGKLAINLTCLVRDTNTEFNLVFLFYLIEGAR